MKASNLLLNKRAYVIPFLTTTIFIFSAHRLTAQQTVSIGTENTKTSAVLWLKGNGTNQGLLLPVVANKSGFSGLNNSDDKGMMIYDLSDNKLYYWNGAAWVEVSSSSGGPTVTQINTGTGLTGGPITTTGTISVAANGITATELRSDAATDANRAVTTNHLRDGAVNTAKILDGTITNADVSGTAAIAVNKLAPGTNGQVLTTSGGNATWATLPGSVSDLNGLNDVQIASPAGGQVLIHDGTSNFQNRTLSGDATVNATGAVTISTDAITSAKIANLAVTDPKISQVSASKVGGIASNTIPRGTGSALVNSSLFDNGSYTGVGRTTAITSSSRFDVDITAGAGLYGGMYLNTTDAAGWPFYGYSTGGSARAWTYFDGGTSTWKVNNNGEHLAVRNDGFVGVGTVSPVRQFEVFSTGSTFLRISGTGAGFASGGLELNGTGTLDWRIQPGLGILVFSQGDVDGTMTNHFFMNNNVFSPVDNGLKTLGQSSARWSTVYAVNGAINTSDIRMKKDIAPMQYGLAEVLKLRTVSFKWKNPNTDTKTHLGLIAQETQQIIPEVIDVGDDEEKSLGLNYSELIPVLINAIQEQQTTIEELQNKIATLEGNHGDDIEHLKNELAEIKKALGMQAKADK